MSLEICGRHEEESIAVDQGRLVITRIIHEIGNARILLCVEHIAELEDGIFNRSEVQSECQPLQIPLIADLAVRQSGLVSGIRVHCFPPDDSCKSRSLGEVSRRPLF